MDAVIGVVWAMKLTHLNVQLLSHLKQQLSTYGSDPNFANLWDQLQRQEGCCGVNNASDYYTTAWFRERNDLDPGDEVVQRAVHQFAPHLPERFSLPRSCCSWPTIAMEQLAGGNCTVIRENFDYVHKGGCYLALHTWMHSMGKAPCLSFYKSSGSRVYSCNIGVNSIQRINN